MHPVLQNKLLGTSRRLAGITLRLTGKDNWHYNALIVEKQKDGLHISDQKQNIESEQELTGFIPQNSAVCLNIEGWGVLLKRAQFNDEGEIQGQLVSNTDEFELYPYQGENSREGFVAIIRTGLLQAVLERLQTIKMDMVSIAVGPFAVIDMLPSLQATEYVLAGNWRMLMAEGKVAEIKPGNGETTNYKWKNDILPSNQLPGFGMVKRFMEGHFEKDIFSQALLNEFSYKKLTTYTGYLVLGLLFTGLLINYLFFDAYNKQYNQISGEYSLNEHVLKQLEQARKEILVKEDLIQKGGLNGATQMAWYVDCLAELMPVRLNLTKVEVHPLRKKIQKGQEITFEMNTISIEGETRRTVDVHRWIEAIKKEDWVKDVEMVYYRQDEDNKMATFNLELVY